MFATGNDYRRFTRSMGILIFTWSIIAIVIVNAYYSSIISYLSTNYKKPEVSTFQELADSNRFKMVTMKGSFSEFDVAVNTKFLNMHIFFICCLITSTITDWNFQSASNIGRKTSSLSWMQQPRFQLWIIRQESYRWRLRRCYCKQSELLHLIFYDSWYIIQL